MFGCFLTEEKNSMMNEKKSGRRGTLKIYLGYAAGVGKTYKTLEEAQQLRAQGVDIVIGYFEPHGRKDTIAMTKGLEIIPRRKIVHRGVSFEEMDTDTILQRHPQVCVVDEFAHTNVPGSERAKRWEDVAVLLDAGIDVLTNMNIQHLESLNDQVWQISGVRVRETVPDWVVKQAGEVVMVDATPQALINRLERGVVYPHEIARRALQNFFKESTLVALRELTLRQTAHEIDIRNPEQVESQLLGGYQEDLNSSAARENGRGSDRILIHVTPEPSSAMLIRRGRRVADYLKADCFAVAVEQGSDKRGMPQERYESLEKHLNFARNLHIETRVLRGDDAAQALVDFARLHEITQIFVARPQKFSVFGSSDNNIALKIVHLARDRQITIVAERERK